MRLRTYGYIVREAVSGIRKNGLMSFASISTVAISLLVLASSLLIAANLEHFSKTLEQEVQVVAYLDEEIAPADAERVVAEARSLPEAAEVVFVSREEGLERLREQFGEQADLLEAVEEENPLRDAIEAKAHRPEQVKALAERIGAIRGVAEVNYQQETVERLFAVTSGLRLAGLGLVVLLCGATLFIISNTIRLTVFARRREIGIMKLVGATDALIRWPFLLEGAILGVGGACIALALTSAGYGWLARQVAENLPFIPLLGSERAVQPLVRILLFLGAGIGAVGSGLSVRRHLRV